MAPMPRYLADAMGDHGQRRLLIEALALYQARELNRPQLRQLLVELHAVDQVVHAVLYGQVRIRVCGGGHRRAKPPIPFTNWRRRPM